MLHAIRIKFGLISINLDLVYFLLFSLILRILKGGKKKLMLGSSLFICKESIKPHEIV